MRLASSPDGHWQLQPAKRMPEHTLSIQLLFASCSTSPEKGADPGLHVDLLLEDLPDNAEPDDQQIVWPALIIAKSIIPAAIAQLRNDLDASCFSLACGHWPVDQAYKISLTRRCRMASHHGTWAVD